MTIFEEIKNELMIKRGENLLYRIITHSFENFKPKVTLLSNGVFNLSWSAIGAYNHEEKSVMPNKNFSRSQNFRWLLLFLSAR